MDGLKNFALISMVSKDYSVSFKLLIDTLLRSARRAVNGENDDVDDVMIMMVTQHIPTMTKSHHGG